MKALLLAAGFGTRLLPYTQTLPKPLFTLNNVPVLDLALEHLFKAGCDAVFVNTHHLAGQIQAHLGAHPLKEKIHCVHEPEILDTGGAIANLREQLGTDDFIVANADIVHDLDLAPVVQAHKVSKALATLVVHDFPQFNKLRVDSNLMIHGFDADPETSLAFTGIQVLSPKILDHLPQATVFSSIDLYRSLCPKGVIRAYHAQNFFWQDMGTPQAYLETARRFLTQSAFGTPNAPRFDHLAGDGSDRKWFRAFPDTPRPNDTDPKHKSLVVSDHGICLQGSDTRKQLDAFVRIGTHLREKQLPVPQILGIEHLSGQVALEDLGPVHLADLAAGQPAKTVVPLYQQVIDQLVSFSVKGIQDFDPSWTCQTPSYSRQMILDLECRYFLEAFVQGYWGVDMAWETLEPAFCFIADQAAAQEADGLMHRDFQSRNIMIKDNAIYFIDFQSARTGPLAYDLASLLIDPYVKLDPQVQDDLLDYCISQLKMIHNDMDKARFLHRYTYCCLARNLQMLGAFGFLTRVKGKAQFAAYIPHALKGLRSRLAPLRNGPLAPLFDCADQLVNLSKPPKE